jgi:hypothetical protein
LVTTASIVDSETEITLEQFICQKRPVVTGEYRLSEEDFAAKCVDPTGDAVTQE